MKSKTSESFIASESKAGIRRDDADEHKQKQLKKGKGNGWDTPQKPTNRFLEAELFCGRCDVNDPLFYIGQDPSVILWMIDWDSLR